LAEQLSEPHPAPVVFEVHGGGLCGSDLHMSE
jgi:D-arabinose 1-dehydrogenase-like Zn-dependent alcohol dehydrogenase